MRHLLILLAGSALMLFGCGGDDGTTATNPPPESPPPATGTPDEPTPPLLGSGPYPVAEIEVRYRHPDLELQYSIGCQGDTATVGGAADRAGVDPNAACDAMAGPELRERLVDGPPGDRVCTEIYGGPDTATVTGTLDEQEVDTTFDRTNGCGIDEWDRLAAALLPPPIGVGTGGGDEDNTDGALPDDVLSDGESQRCSHPDGYSISYPSNWFTNLGSVLAPCSQFHPQPFTVPDGTDARVAAITAYVDAVAFSDVETDTSIDGTWAATVVDGHQAVRMSGAYSGSAFWPDGTPVTRYAIDLSAGVDDGPGTLFVDVMNAGNADHDEARPVLDAMVATLALDPEDDGATTDPAAGVVVARYEGGGAPFVVTADIVEGEVCMRVEPADDATDAGTCATAPERTGVRLATLETETGEIIAGVAGASVFRVGAIGPDGAPLMSYLPVAVDPDAGSAGGSTPVVGGWAFPFPPDEVGELVMYDIFGNEIGRTAP